MLDKPTLPINAKDNGKKPLDIKRTRAVVETNKSDGPTSVSAGPVDKVIELAFNPTREKIREVTIIDRNQGRLLPQLDLVDMMWQNCIEIAAFREDSKQYAVTYQKPAPVPPNLIDEFTYRTAQWQKSIAGKNLERATDIALAEMEAKAGDEEDLTGNPDAYLEK